MPSLPWPSSSSSPMFTAPQIDSAYVGGAVKQRKQILELHFYY